jgi:hypothetical protein
MRGFGCAYGDRTIQNERRSYVMPMLKEKKTQVITDFHRHDTDTGSPDVQIAIMTEQAR